MAKAYLDPVNWNGTSKQALNAVSWGDFTPSVTVKNGSDSFLFTVTEAPIAGRIVKSNDAVAIAATDTSRTTNMLRASDVFLFSVTESQQIRGTVLRTGDSLLFAISETSTVIKPSGVVVKHTGDSLLFTVDETVRPITGQLIVKHTGDSVLFSVTESAQIPGQFFPKHGSDTFAFTVDETTHLMQSGRPSLSPEDINAIKDAIWRGVEVEVGTGITPLLALQLKAAVEGGQGANLGRPNQPQTFYGAGRGLTVSRVVSTVDPATGQRTVTLTLSET